MSQRTDRSRTLVVLSKYDKLLSSIFTSGTCTIITFSESNTIIQEIIIYDLTYKGLKKKLTLHRIKYEHLLN